MSCVLCNICLDVPKRWSVISAFLMLILSLPHAFAVADCGCDPTSAGKENGREGGMSLRSRAGCRWPQVSGVAKATLGGLQVCGGGAYTCQSSGIPIICLLCAQHTFRVR